VVISYRRFGTKYRSRVYRNVGKKLPDSLRHNP
jgi:hypothetical protein